MHRWILLALPMITASLGIAGRAAAKTPGSAADLPRFPAVTGRNLNGREFHLPAEFEGRLNLVFLAYERNQQDNVNTWLPLAASLKASEPDLAYYELPTLDRYPGFIRSFIDGGMRHGIPDHSVRGRTITLYLNRGSFLKSLQIASTKAIDAILVTQKGEILWSAKGDYSQGKEKSLRDVLASLHARE